MKIMITFLITLFSCSAGAEGINIFGKLVIFDRGEFVNPYNVHEDSRGALSIVIDRTCKALECSGKVIIGPIFEPNKIESTYSVYPEPDFSSTCNSNVILKSYHDNILSIYYQNDYEYYVMFVGSKRNFFEFEEKLCAIN